MREAIYAALWARYSGLTEFKAKSRRLRHINKLQPEEFPALFMACRNQAQDQEQHTKPRIHLPADLYIYVHGDEDSVPATQLNTLIDLVDSRIRPGPAKQIQDLGFPRGVIHHCYINGTIETDEGTLGEKGIAIVPIDILATF